MFKLFINLIFLFFLTFNQALSEDGFNEWKIKFKYRAINSGISEKIVNEISTTAGYEFNKNNSVLATSGNNKFKFDIKQQGFAWMTSNKKENIMVKVMKKGSRIMVTGYNEKGSQTIDHYSLLGFTKAYSTAKKACS